MLKEFQLVDRVPKQFAENIFKTLINIELSHKTLLTFFRFGVSTDSRSFPYCVAHDFERNQSAGRDGVLTIPLRALDTLIQF